ncbi:hypothetical protein A2U01_0066191, partial [Trifolium medium]|nr:hypothetical protein [Trifolium medium]
SKRGGIMGQWEQPFQAVEFMPFLPLSALRLYEPCAWGAVYWAMD